MLDSKRRATVLIADDNAEWRSAIARVLEPYYHILGFVTRGDEVVERAVWLHPEVITLDVSMPGESGLKLLPDLRLAVPSAVIIVVTTTSGRVYNDEAYRLGASGYVLKRNVASELLPAIHKTVAKTVTQATSHAIGL